MTKSLIPSFFLSNLFISFLVSLVVLVLFILSHYTHRCFLSVDVTFFEDSPFFLSSESLPISEVLPLPYMSPPSDALSCSLQVYHRRHRAVALPLSSAEVPDDSRPVPPIFPTPALSSTDHLPIALRKEH
eukprot:XP_019076168.1 PREDICTED: uncharacterized protein LOC109122804 [Vitis vinifera]